jgi:Ger(x)C family germination protein
MRRIALLPVKFVLPLLAVVTLAGCWDMRELEHMFYAHAVGVDFEDGVYKLYVQIVDFSALGKHEGGNPQPQDYGGAWVGKGVGGSIQEAIQDLYSSTQRRIYWGHLNSVVFGEKMLKQGIDSSMGVLSRYHEFRYTHWLFATREEIEDVLLATPILEFSPVYSQLGDPIDVYRQSSLIRPKRMFQLIVELNEESLTPMLPLIHLERSHWRDKNKRYAAIDIDEAVILKDGKWHAVLSETALLGKRWLESETERTQLFIKRGNKTEAVLVFRRPKHDVEWQVKDGRIRFDIRLHLQAAVTEHNAGMTNEEIERRAAEVIRDEIRRTYLEGVKRETDVFNLLDPVYRSRYRVFRKLTEGGRFPLDESSLRNIEVSVTIVNTGKTSDSFRVR